VAANAIFRGNDEVVPLRVLARKVNELERAPDRETARIGGSGRLFESRLQCFQSYPGIAVALGGREKASRVFIDLEIVEVISLRDR